MQSLVPNSNNNRSSNNNSINSNNMTESITITSKNTPTTIQTCPNFFGRPRSRHQAALKKMGSPQDFGNADIFLNTVRLDYGIRLRECLSAIRPTE